MTNGELIDELMKFEFGDEIDYLNCMIITKSGAKWDLILTGPKGFRKFEVDPELSSISDEEPAQAVAGADLA